MSNEQRKKSKNDAGLQGIDVDYWCSFSLASISIIKDRLNFENTGTIFPQEIKKKFQ